MNDWIPATHTPLRARLQPGDGLLWRGPTWISTYWFIARGPRRHGRQDLADRIADASRDLLLKDGFREFYHPDTCAPFGAQGFGWSTLAVDM